MRKKQYKIFAAIHLGSEMISMQIVQYRNLNNIKILEECNRRVRLGEETFKNKIIPFSMVNEICELLVGFKRLMTEYEVEEYSMQATTAVREALNRVFLIDQIYIRTGLKVTVIDLPEEIYTKYQSIRRTMKLDGLTGVDESMLMMDISSGGLGITFVKDNVIRYQQNLNIGVIRVKESFNRNQRSSMKFNQALAEYLSSTMGAVRDALKNEQVRYLVLSGAESELLLQMLGIEFKAGVIRIKTEQFMQLFKTVHALNLPQIIKVFKINEDIAELVVPTSISGRKPTGIMPQSWSRSSLVCSTASAGVTIMTRHIPVRLKSWPWRCLINLASTTGWTATAASYFRQRRCCTISANTYRCAAIRCTATSCLCRAICLVSASWIKRLWRWPAITMRTGCSAAVSTPTWRKCRRRLCRW